MTAQLSREDVKAFIEQVESDMAEGWEAQAFELKLAKYVLAGMDSEPVGYLFRNDYGAVLYSISDDTTEGFTLIGPIYAAPPAPVAVPDVSEAVREALDRVACPDAYMRVAVEACRAAMLKAGPATAATVPDGWTANADVNDALVMLDRIDTVDCADDERIESVKSIIRRLAAAPVCGNFRENENSSTNNFRENGETSTNTPAPDPIDHGYRADCECSGCIATARICDELAVGSSVIKGCSCRTCRPVTITDMRFVVCPDCGNKRCPRANDHRNSCTGSNEPGQPGSAYPAAPELEV